MTGLNSDTEQVSRPAEATAEPAQLDAIEAVILQARDVEDWQREALLAQVRSLDHFYRAHRHR